MWSKLIIKAKCIEVQLDIGVKLGLKVKVKDVSASWTLAIVKQMGSLSDKNNLESCTIGAQLVYSCLEEMEKLDGYYQN